MSFSNRAWITECPRDAMQGIHDFIPTASKISYLNTLLDVGFDRLDFGSFVSPRAIPQMADTEQVIESIHTGTGTELIAIIANLRGAENASKYRQISYVGFPFSISETFQQKNTNTSIRTSFETVEKILEVTSRSGQELLVYISMAFGNPYGDKWDNSIVLNWMDELRKLGIKKFALADTVGIATPEIVHDVTKSVISGFSDLEIGVHLHCKPGNWESKLDAAFRAGCRHFDGALKGFGGCPMAEDELVGNMATENLVQYLEGKNVETRLNKKKFKEAMVSASAIFL